ncbi:MAG: cytochrome C biogenesis protein [Candidatus Magasanikbacteria bacterium]|nr:cytochrome C biogenesis protein [Candidatus Magasanikbacteria bacterium]
MSAPNLYFAFIAGLVSFLAPCVLPLIPGFIAYLAGAAAGGAAPTRRATFFHSLAFVVGFSLVFAALGVLLNTILERVAYDVQLWLGRLGGAIIILFGLQLTGLLKISWLEREHKFKITGRPGRYLTSLLFGAAFAVGWTPCVGAVLGAILALAATAPGSAFTLLLTYAIGLGIPFLAVGLFTAPAARLIERYAAAARYISAAFGILLIAVGVLIFTGSLNLIANFSFVNRWLLRMR